ncbi:hypothetical protein [Azoarcus olearius]|uniref:Hypothetical membrane protein n=1 Tax=Azoarcus sp. (strain BH72) TaxID=418699 RepID=A1K9Z6_AZOSB|nr:hypothetical protein [Azoarcus olearius]CAL95651.1 hypothetical membrane protein [Azoarcus olearius]
MHRLHHWFAEYPVLVGLAAAAAITLLVAAVLAVTMHRAGVSLKPLVWIFVLIGLIGLPQAAVHVLDVIRFEQQRADAQPAQAAAVLQPVPWELVFGHNADPSLMTDPRAALAPVLGEAAIAVLSFTAEGESALAARFADARAATRALDAYGNFFQFALARGSDRAGWTARRYGGGGEWNHVVVAGNELYAWTGPSREAVIARRERVLGSWQPPPPTPPQRAHEARLVSGSLSGPALLGFAALNLAAVVAWFFWGAAWAARTDPGPDAHPMPASVLRLQVLAAYAGGGPVQADAAPDGSILLDWNYADARWFDLMHLHRLQRTQRLVLNFDEAERTVRVREYWSRIDTSAGYGGLRLAWQHSSGIELFRVEEERHYGIQLDAAGRPSGELVHATRFDSRLLKQPAIDRVTAAGWRWQPTLVSAPRWMRWLTG